MAVHSRIAHLAALDVDRIVMELLGYIVTRPTDVTVGRDHIIVQGPSGTGKTQLLKKLLAKVCRCLRWFEVCYSMLSLSVVSLCTCPGLPLASQGM